MELRLALVEIGVVLVAGLPTAVALSAAGGFFLAGRSLAPVREMAARAANYGRLADWETPCA